MKRKKKAKRNEVTLSTEIKVGSGEERANERVGDEPVEGEPRQADEGVGLPDLSSEEQTDHEGTTRQSPSGVTRKVPTVRCLCPSVNEALFWTSKNRLEGGLVRRV